MTPTRREIMAAPLLLQAPARRPNIIMVITDDQGYGDIGLHGNPVLATPHTDSIARQGMRFTQFHVSPVCAPTRASLMTGRWNYRTGVTDTYLGRAMMRPTEVTLAECLRGAGYRTGIFGKWHLGDNAPLRATDQGFETSVLHRGGGLGQPSSPPGTGYFDPPLERNNVPYTARGYCTDIFFDETIAFIDRHRGEPFFAYVSTNAPHTPLEIGDEWVAPFRGRGLNDTTEKIYGMVANLDHGLGRMLAHLRHTGLEQNTIVVFLTDNGPQQPGRYNAGLRGLKATPYQGGIQVPCFVKWPGRIKPGGAVAAPAAHVDLMPTLLDMAGVPAPRDRHIDGVSLRGTIEGQAPPPPERPLFLQWHRGDAPEAFRNSAVRAGKWKLVNGEELYNLDIDPFEQNDMARFWPQHVRRLRAEYERWFEDVSKDGYDPPRIWLGSDLENPVLLTRQDWRGPQAQWTTRALGHYEVEVKRAGQYEVELRFPKLDAPAKAVFTLGNARTEAAVPEGATTIRLPALEIPAGTGRAEGRLEAGGAAWGAHYTLVRRVETKAKA
jgi:arylsulfatase A-like enzyme